MVADGRATNDLLTGLARIGIDEIAYRKGHRYLTVIVDHGTGRLVWAAEGRNKDTLEKFFDALGAQRAAKLTHVSADGAEWIHAVVGQRVPEGGDLPRSVPRRGLGDESPGQGPRPHHDQGRDRQPARDVGGAEGVSGRSPANSAPSLASITTTNRPSTAHIC